jgi:hypothetical protein
VIFLQMHQLLAQWKDLLLRIMQLISLAVISRIKEKKLVTNRNEPFLFSTFQLSKKSVLLFSKIKYF